MPRSNRLGAARLVILTSLGLAIAAGGAVAQQPAPAPGPTLQITSASARQIGTDLRFELRLSRALPVGELAPSRRVICLVLSPNDRSRRHVCVRRRGAGLTATTARIDVTGGPTSATRPVRGARVDVAGGVLTLRVPADALRVRLGRTLNYRATVMWRDASPCSADSSLTACSQTVPATGAQQLQTRAPSRPAFTRRGRLRLLATGDSMIQIIDGFLERRLRARGGTKVDSDAHISTGISKPKTLDWVRKARGQAGDLKPDVSVVFLGANDGFPMKTRSGASVACCDAPWVTEYARRTESMMRSYLRGGRSYVYWLTLPVPRRSDFARIYRAVNVAIRQAAARAGAGVRVIDLVRVFTPGGHFRQNITYRGRTVNARQEDGVHLSTAGARIAASIIIDRLRDDRALP